MKTFHQYLDKHPIKKDSKKLIVGTIHPHNHEDFKVKFFYGNVLSLWNILHEAFPDELDNPSDKDSILRFLDNRKISMSDTVLEAERINPTALDDDFIPRKLNMNLIQKIKDSEVQEIFFTSGFAKNNAFKLFYESILNLKITKKIKDDRGCILNDERLGRPIKLIVLYSPSGNANRGIANSKIYKEKKEYYKRISDTPVQAFKVDYYREKFS